MKYNKSFLGTGWSFPPEFSKSAKDVIMVSDDKDIQQSLEVLLSTGLGERIMQPTFGASLQNVVFDAFNTGTQTYVKNLIQQAILYNEPRITLNKITIDTSELQDGVVYITINYTIRTTNSRSNYVFPFYLVEGTNLKR